MPQNAAPVSKNFLNKVPSGSPVSNPCCTHICTYMYALIMEAKRFGFALVNQITNSSSNNYRKIKFWNLHLRKVW